MAPRPILFSAVLAALAASEARPQGLVPVDCSLDQRGNTINSCKYCHTSGYPRAGNDDIDRQGAFSSQENRFLNALDPAPLDTLVPRSLEPSWPAYLALDNLGQALAERGRTPGVGAGQGRYRYLPDLDPEQTGADGFANDGWRAFKWKLQRDSWPKDLGRIQQNWVRMAERFRRRADGAYDSDTYGRNLDLLVAALRGSVTASTYAGMATDEPVAAYQFPLGTEVTHYLYYLDPERPGMTATRIKEVRWMVKSVPRALDLGRFGMALGQEKALSLAYQDGDPATTAQLGLIYNNDGWDIACFIEEPDGALRPQSLAELTQCLGCHSRRLGAIRDSHWNSLQRQLPGALGWTRQDHVGIYDYYNAAVGRAEMAEFYGNVYGDATGVPGRPDGSIEGLPDRRTAEALTWRYYQIVQTQSYSLGREPALANPGFLRQPSTDRFRPKEQQVAWNPDLDFGAFDRATRVTAVLDRPDAGGLPNGFALAQNYPNPCNPRSTIAYAVPVGGPVALRLYGVLGQPVATLASGMRAPGEHRLDVDLAGLASGVYLHTLEAGPTRMARRLAVVR